MKNVYLRKGGYWFSQMIQGKRVWVNLQTSDYAEAVKRTIEVRGNPLVKPSHTLADDVERFVAHKVRMNQYSRASAHTKRLALLKLCAWLPGECTLASVTSRCLTAFYEQLQKTVTESTAQGYMMTLRSFFRWAVETERARIDNPISAIKLAKCDARGRKAWCDRELKNRLLANAPNDDLRFILFCGFEAGLRRGEIVEARRDWFDLPAGLLHVRSADGPPRLRDGEIPFRPKDRDERTIPLTKPCLAFLKRYLKGRAPPDFALMPEVKHGVWRYRYDFRKPFDEYMKSQNCEWVTPHVMRHSFASILASAGISIFKVAQWLGDDVRVVQRHYAKLAANDDDIHALTSAVSAG